MAASLRLPAGGLLLSIALVAGLLALEAWTARHVPTASWILAELRARPFPYAYLLVATLVMMTVLGWIVGRKEDLLGGMSTTDPLTGLANRRRISARRSPTNSIAPRATRRRCRCCSSTSTAQGHQRPARACQRRPGAAARGGSPAPQLPRHRSRSALRRRRVRRARGQHAGQRSAGPRAHRIRAASDVQPTRGARGPRPDAQINTPCRSGSPTWTRPRCRPSTRYTPPPIAPCTRRSGRTRRAMAAPATLTPAEPRPRPLRDVVADEGRLRDQTTDDAHQVPRAGRACRGIRSHGQSAAGWRSAS